MYSTHCHLKKHRITFSGHDAGWSSCQLLCQVLDTAAVYAGWLSSWPTLCNCTAHANMLRPKPFACRAACHHCSSLAQRFSISEPSHELLPTMGCCESSRPPYVPQYGSAHPYGLMHGKPVAYGHWINVWDPLCFLGYGIPSFSS